MGRIGYSRTGATLRSIAWSGAMLATLALVGSARAQTAVPSTGALPIPAGASGPTEEDRRAAHDQYEQGKAAFEAGDYLRAAPLFLGAYRLAPHHDPLWNAARAYELAGKKVRAANLYTLYLEIAPVDARDRDRATSARRELGGGLGRLEVHGHAKDLRVDDEPTSGTTIFVAPGQHIVRGTVSDKPVESIVTVSSGATLSVALEASASPSATGSPKTSDATPSTAAPARGSSGGRPLSPGVVYVGAGLTLASTGLMIASGIDTLNAKSQVGGANSGQLVSDGAPFFGNGSRGDEDALHGSCF